MILQHTESIWTAQQDLRFMGLRMGARMTVLKVSRDDDLLIYSPIAPRNELVEELKALGKVRYIIAPNTFHYLFAKDFQAQFPESTLYCSPGLPDKLPEFQSNQVLKEDSTYPWSNSVEHIIVAGVPLLEEVVLYVPEARSLIVADLGLNISHKQPFLTRLVFRLMGSYNRFGWSTIEKLLLIKNKEEFANTVDNILSRDFDSIIVSHGDIVQSEGNSLFREAFSG